MLYCSVLKIVEEADLMNNINTVYCQQRCLTRHGNNVVQYNIVQSSLLQ